MDGFFPKHWKAGALQLLNNSFIKYRLATNYESPFVALISFFSTQLLPAPHRPAPVLCSAGASSTSRSKAGEFNPQDVIAGCVNFRYPSGVKLRPLLLPLSSFVAAALIGRFSPASLTSAGA